MKIRKLDWLIIFFLTVSFFISNFHLLFDGVHSDAPLYRFTNGDIGWWLFLGLFPLNLAWMIVFGIVIGLSKTRLNPKQACMIGAYGFSLYKDVYDWVSNNNQGTKYIDWIVTVMLFIFVQFLFWGWKRIKGSI